MAARESSERAVLSVRFPIPTHRWMTEQADSQGISTNDFVVRTVEDLRSAFGLPPTMSEALEEDRKALHLGQRDYVMHLLTRRYEQLLTNKPGFDARKSNKP